MGRPEWQDCPLFCASGCASGTSTWSRSLVFLDGFANAAITHTHDLTVLVTKWHCPKARHDSTCVLMCPHQNHCSSFVLDPPAGPRRAAAIRQQRKRAKLPRWRRIGWIITVLTAVGIATGLGMVYLWGSAIYRGALRLFGWRSSIPIGTKAASRNVRPSNCKLTCCRIFVRHCRCLRAHE